jgi:hypothetical protein
MHRHAWSERAALQLNEVEVIDTLESMYDNLGMVFFGVLSATLGLLLPLRVVGLAGYVYFLICIPKTIIPFRMARKRRAAEERMLSSPPQTPG